MMMFDTFLDILALIGVPVAIVYTFVFLPDYASAFFFGGCLLGGLFVETFLRLTRQPDRTNGRQD